VTIFQWVSRLDKRPAVASNGAPKEGEESHKEKTFYKALRKGKALARG
jgi:hypothetical protein